MNTSFLDDIRNAFRNGSAVMRFILINIAVFLVVNLFSLFFFLFSVAPEHQINLVQWLAVPADWRDLLHKPWTIITYMFLHQDFFHILSNMIMLYFGGQLFTEYLGENKFVATYFLGGIAGAFLYIVVFNTFPAFKNITPFSIALGASASVLAVFVAIATYLPNFSVNLILFGPVRLKFIAIVLVGIDLISIDKGNPGGHIAHLGGAMYGYLAMTQLKKGRDFSAGFSKVIFWVGNLFKPTERSKMKVAHKKTKDDLVYNAQKKAKQESIDKILDKISHSGYESLTKQEKEELFKISKE